MKGLKDKLNRIIRDPSLIEDIVKHNMYSWKDRKELEQFIYHLRESSPYYVDSDYKPKLNRLCYIEDWDSVEMQQAFSELQIPRPREHFIHRKDWEWALGIIAMNRFKKINENSIAIGVGAGKEVIPFYLANKIRHVYATDLYAGIRWQKTATIDFVTNPAKYAPFSYKDSALTVLQMDAANLEFPRDHFDIAFSFSSIEHFGDDNHSGALKSMKEIERVLKPGGIAVITTEYVLNSKEHKEFFNKSTIYSHLLDKLDGLSLVEPLDLRITTKTLDIIIDYFSQGFDWDTYSVAFKKNHPHIVLKIGNILFTSLMLVFSKSEDGNQNE
jgi:SAM-dependent methyltransferase